jgi:hypothetical protein
LETLLGINVHLCLAGTVVNSEEMAPAEAIHENVKE